MALFTRFKERLTLSRMKRFNRRHRFKADEAEDYGLPFDAPKNHTDCYFVYGHDPLTQASFFYRRADRGKAPTETWLFFQTPDGRKFRFPLLSVERNLCPFTLRYDPKEKLWTYRYQGILQEILPGASGNPANVSTSVFLTFIPSRPIIDFASGLNLRQKAHAIALERWSHRFQKNSERHQQTHYEQHGHLKGTILLGSFLYTLDMVATREHSFGYVDWNYKDRHIRLIALLEDQSALHLHWERYPSLSHLRFGYWETPDKTILLKDSTPITQMPYGDDVPTSFVCDFTTLDGKKHHVEAQKQGELAYPFENGIYTVHEGYGTFTVDGIPGRGLLEFGYHKDKTRHIRKKEKRRKG